VTEVLELLAGPWKRHRAERLSFQLLSYRFGHWYLELLCKTSDLGEALNLLSNARVLSRQNYLDHSMDSVHYNDVQYIWHATGAIGDVLMSNCKGMLPRTTPSLLKYCEHDHGHDRSADVNSTAVHAALS
jgi:hypothetical protein